MSHNTLHIGAQADGGNLAGILASFIERLAAGVRASREAQAKTVICATARRYSDCELSGFGWKDAEIRSLKSQ